MAYSLKKIFSIILNSKRKKIEGRPKQGNYFLFYDKEENMCCYHDWCYEVTEHKIKLSDLQPQYKPSVSSPFYMSIKKDIEENGVDMTKGVITLKYDYKIADGHHRYFILKELYGPDYEVTVLRPIKKYNFILHCIFLFILIPLIKLAYRLINSIGSLFIKR